MRAWLLRGLVFAFLMILLRLVQGAMINTWETKAGLISICLLIPYAIVPVIWGFLDGRSDANAQIDPDRRADLAMVWLLAGLFAGVVSGAVCVLISLVYEGLYVGGFVNEVTTFAAFTALTVFINAMIGVAVGRYLVDRKYKDVPVRLRGKQQDDDNPDTDVFAAVRDDDDRTQASAR